MFDNHRVLEMPKGSLETQPLSNARRDLGRAILIKKAVIRDLNQLIMDEGEEKIIILLEIKDSKKGIYQLQRGNKGLSLKVISRSKHLIKRIAD